MKNRREFLSLVGGAVFGTGLAAVGFNIDREPAPIHVPNDRLPVVTTSSTSSDSEWIHVTAVYGYSEVQVS